MVASMGFLPAALVKMGFVVVWEPASIHARYVVQFSLMQSACEGDQRRSARPRPVP